MNHPVRILTIGHSTRPIDVFLDLLGAHRVERLADVRTVPRSRRYPHFSREPLAASLASHGIEYGHVAELGGLRRPRPDSIHRGWRNEGFRGYADHMESAEFEAALERLIAAASERRLVVMCAEAVPWSCHRSLLSDALMVRGVKVEHVLGLEAPRSHQLTPWAEVTDRRLVYSDRKRVGGQAALDLSGNLGSGE